ncbi:cytochrome P450 CYP749A22-like [Lycium barbarum]|uniref:cytochrome P450 CYP749A22-like n=1 Tax=Lycium barbarum TaxID=112863 RepID=UPI00293E592A|nr:cytochrome P450 CYP749A22-like [Lycium barbarum]
MIIFFLVFLGLLVLAKFLYKSWWYPISLQNLMKSQGIRGPSYKFPNGNDTEIRDMEMKSNTGPMELTHEIFPRLQPHFYSWIKLYGRIFLFWHGSHPELVVTDVDLIKEILSNKEGSFLQHKLAGPLEDLFGDGLPFSEGQKWSKLRKVAEIAFHAQSLKDMVPTIIGSVEEMLKTWKSYEGKEIEVYEEFRQLSSENIAKTAFGSCYLEGKHIFQRLDRLSILVYMNIGKTRIPGIDKIFRTSEDKESDKLGEALRESFMLLIREREDNVKTGQAESYGSDFLGSLLKAHHDSDVKTRISVADIIDECKTFYFAGHEPTTIVLSWVVLLLAINPDWQQKARKEVLELFGQENPKTDGISKLKILGMIINETLRLYPPALYIMRSVTRKARLGEFTLPAGIDLHIPPLSVHKNREVWGEDAHIFNPDRFAEGVSKATRDQLMAFLAFGFGPRKCVGSSFAVMEIKIALSMILQRYKFTLSPNYNHLPTVILNLRPKHGVQIMLHPLQNY